MKAYDRINWFFMEEVLGEIGLPVKWRQLFMDCVRVEHLQLILNGELIEIFTPSRGIRKGEPMSPYMFILCMEELSHTLCNKIKKRE